MLRVSRYGVVLFLNYLLFAASSRTCPREGGRFSFFGLKTKDKLAAGVHALLPASLVRGLFQDDGLFLVKIRFFS